MPLAGRNCRQSLAPCPAEAGHPTEQHGRAGSPSCRPPAGARHKPASLHTHSPVLRAAVCAAPRGSHGPAVRSSGRTVQRTESCRSSVQTEQQDRRRGYRDKPTGPGVFSAGASECRGARALGSPVSRFQEVERRSGTSREKQNRPGMRAQQQERPRTHTGPWELQAAPRPGGWWGACVGGGGSPGGRGVRVAGAGWRGFGGSPFQGLSRLPRGWGLSTQRPPRCALEGPHARPAGFRSSPWAVFINTNPHALLLVPLREAAGIL